VYYNAGNSYYHLHQYGWALWCYKKALQYEPTNTLFAENFLIVKNKIGKNSLENTHFTSLNWWQKIAQFYLLEQWAWRAFICFLLAALSWSCRKIWDWPAFTIAIPKIALFAFLIFLLGGFACYASEKFYSYGIIVRNTALLNNAKQSGDNTVSKTEGLQVKILAKEINTVKNATRVKIQLPNGDINWIEDADIVRL
jgi:hypothetical protein